METSELEGYSKAIFSFAQGETIRIFKSIEEPIKFPIISGLLLKNKRERIFLELLAYYEFLVFIYLANIFEVKNEELHILQRELENAIMRAAKKYGRWGRIAKSSFFRKSFPNTTELVGCYVRGDKSLSNVSESAFIEIARSLSFSDKLNDFILNTYVVSYLRLLMVFGISIENANSLFIWKDHAYSINTFRSILKEAFVEAFPENIK